MNDIWSVEYKESIIGKLRTVRDTNEYLSDQLATVRAERDKLLAKLSDIANYLDECSVPTHQGLAQLSLFGRVATAITAATTRAESAEADAERLASALRAEEEALGMALDMPSPFRADYKLRQLESTLQRKKSMEMRKAALTAHNALTKGDE